MYICRAYQSPASAADCGPQCAQMPNLASRNQSGMRYAASDSRVGLKMPGSVSALLIPSMRAEVAAGNALARIARAFRLVMDKSFSPCNGRLVKESGSVDQVNR